MEDAEDIEGEVSVGSLSSTVTASSTSRDRLTLLMDVTVDSTAASVLLTCFYTF